MLPDPNALDGPLKAINRLTNKCQPKRRHLHKANQLDYGNDTKQYPQRGLCVECEPKEALVRRVNCPRLRICRLKDPF